MCYSLFGEKLFLLLSPALNLIYTASRIFVKGNIDHPAVVTDMEKCKGCALCAYMCPDVAIKVEKEV